MNCDTITTAYDKFINARNEAYNDLKEFIKNLPGQIIRTLPNSRVPSLYVTWCVDNFGEEFKNSPIYAIRYDEGEDSLFFCTDNSLDNYTYDTHFYFESYNDFTEEEKEHLEEIFKDIAYFEEFDSRECILSTTLISILSGLPYYIEK